MIIRPPQINWSRSQTGKKSTELSKTLTLSIYVSVIILSSKYFTTDSAFRLLPKNVLQSKEKLVYRDKMCIKKSRSII